MTYKEQVWKSRSSNCEIWLDLLCWESVIKILLAGNLKPGIIHYCQASTLFLPFLNKFAKMTGIKFVHVVDFVAGEERINGTSAYEAIHTRLKKIMDEVSDRWKQKPLVRKFASKNKFNPVKIREHLKEAAFLYFHCPVEISVISEIRHSGKQCHFMFRKTPFAEILLKELRPNSVRFYTTYFSHYFKILKRDEYIYDTMKANTYYRDRFESFCLLVAHWLLNVIKVFWARKYQYFNNKMTNQMGINIGVEMLQSRLRLDEINDLFWFEESQIKPKNVYTIESHSLDSKSEENLACLGINRAKPIRFSILLKRLFLVRSEEGSIIYFAPDITFIRQTIWSMLLLPVILIRWDECFWLNFQLTRFNNQSYYWNSIYKQLNIRILSSIIDYDNEKLTKAQALEMVGGFFVGTHWSNIPLIIMINQKCYDILFAWGPHFVKNIFNSYPSLATFNIGYPSDHYFRKQEIKARALRDKYPGKFILSYQDNIMANDIPYSRNMQLDIHEMFIDILDKNDQIVLFLKPKRFSSYSILVKEIPRIKELIESERIVFFTGENERTKAVPAMIGMASDLAIGMGISTAASECFFAGTLSFLVDLTGFKNNEFGNKGLGDIVFRDVKSLEIAIQKIIDNGMGDKYLKYKDLYKTLDPFQDGKAYRRVGFVLKNLQLLLNQGASREEATKEVNELYENFIILKHNININGIKSNLKDVASVK